MKIFSNFNTRAPLEDYKKALEQYGADKVMFFRRDRIYLFFFVILPSIGMWLLLILVSLVWLQFAQWYFSNFFINVLFTTLFSLVAFIALGRIILNYINYLLDYTIITPYIITSYNQSWLFKREIRTLDTDKIKAINVMGSSLIQSLFNYGSLIFMAEGDDEDQWDVRLNFLNNPTKLKDEVVHLINLSKDDA